MFACFLNIFFLLVHFCFVPLLWLPCNWYGFCFCVDSLPCLLCIRCMKDTCVPEQKMLKDPRRLYAPGRMYHIVERKPCRYITHLHRRIMSSKATHVLNKVSSLSLSFFGKCLLQIRKIPSGCEDSSASRRKVRTHCSFL